MVPDFGISPLATYGSILAWIFLASLASSILLSILDRSTENFLPFLLFAVAFSSTGAVVGTAAGLSRVGVAGNVLPASLVFIAGGVGYIFSIDVRKGVVSSIILLSFTSALFFFYFEGSHSRSESENLAAKNRLKQEHHDAHREKCLEFRLSLDFYSLEIDDKRVFSLQCNDFIEIPYF